MVGGPKNPEDTGAGPVGWGVTNPGKYAAPLCATTLYLFILIQMVWAYPQRSIRNGLLAVHVSKSLEVTETNTDGA